MKRFVTLILTPLFLFGIRLFAQTIVLLPNLSDTHIPLQMIRIEPGPFLMGDNSLASDKKTRAWPEHEVTISRPFEISLLEITQAQYEAIRGAKANHSKPIALDAPVNKVNWFDCQLFLRKLNKLGLGHFRLPTEAEWEYAYTLADSSGIQNMDSSVGEWCSDRWQTVSDRGSQIDPHYRGGRLNFINPLQKRVFKGSPEDDGKVNPGKRYFEEASDYHYVIGFRVVRDVESEFSRLKDTED